MWHWKICYVCKIHLPQLYFGGFTQGAIYFFFFAKITIVINEGKTMSFAPSPSHHHFYRYTLW